MRLCARPKAVCSAMPGSRLANRAGRSAAAVQLRLQHSDAGTDYCNGRRPMPGSRTLPRPPTAGLPFRADLYTGYGALLAPSRKDGRRDIGLQGSAISRDERNVLRIQFPADAREEIEETLQLIHWFGAVGSRSRNGWGSISLASGDVALADWPSSDRVGPVLPRPGRLPGRRLAGRHRTRHNRTTGLVFNRLHDLG